MDKKYKFQKIEENEDLIKKAFYPIDLEEGFYEGIKFVLRPYEVKGGFIVTKWRSNDFCKQNIGLGRIRPKMYNPFLSENLLNAIIKINTDKIESILDFCDEYGLLTASGLDQQEPIKDFVYGVINLKESVELYWNLKNGIERDITPDLEQCYLFEVATSGDIDYNYFTLAEERLIFMVNQYLTNIYPQIKKSSEGDYIPCYSFNNLISVAYYHLFQLMTENKQLNKCRNCGSLFVPRRPNDKYCRSFKPGERSACENRYNQIVSWSRKKVFSGEKTIEEVAKMKGRPVKEVRGWIENYNPDPKAKNK